MNHANVWCVAACTVIGRRDLPQLPNDDPRYEEREELRLSRCDTHYHLIDGSLDALYASPSMRRTVVCALLQDYKAYVEGGRALPPFSQERLKYQEYTDLEVEHGSHPERQLLEQCFVATNDPADETPIGDIVNTLKQAAGAANAHKINPSNVGLALAEWCLMHQHVTKQDVKRNGKKVRVIRGVLPRSAVGF